MHVVIVLRVNRLSLMLRAVYDSRIVDDVVAIVAIAFGFFLVAL
jgi:hypothetical protein